MVKTKFIETAENKNPLFLLLEKPEWAVYCKCVRTHTHNVGGGGHKDTTLKLLVCDTSVVIQSDQTCQQDPNPNVTGKMTKFHSKYL